MNNFEIENLIVTPTRKKGYSELTGKIIHLKSPSTLSRCYYQFLIFHISAKSKFLFF